MIVLAWKLSLIDFIAERLNELPVLLLDDVLSELDQQKRVNLFSLISPEIQTFITTTEIAELLPFLSRKPKIAEIDSGQIRPWKESDFRAVESIQTSGKSTSRLPRLSRIVAMIRTMA